MPKLDHDHHKIFSIFDLSCHNVV